MKSGIVVVVIALVVGSTGVAFARDHLELLCSTVADPRDGGAKMPLFIHFYEGRSADGKHRDETLSNIYQGKLFQATRVNTSDGLSKDAPIALKAGKAIRFRGTYTVANASGGWVLKLTGLLNEDPTAPEVTYRDAAATLTCVDLSI